MSGAITVVSGGPVFDGTSVHRGVEAVFRQGVFQGLCPSGTTAQADDRLDLGGSILAPGFVDLQVNGGGGVMLNDDPSPHSLRRMAEAHATLGVAGFLPTLITDCPQTVTQAIRATGEALALGVPGVAGLHLEGPHLSVARKGAHDPAHIRPMTDADLEALVAAKATLPVLMVTLAPESVTIEQVRRLSDAGVIVSLGHTDAGYRTCQAYAAAGARAVTHLFNAMSQFGSREPGLVGAALDGPGLCAGLIADGVHVHPASMRLAWRAKGAARQLFLVSDAMAVAGTGLDH
ncbi:MAG: N-acetylglucosamine-6-phosphate deacetylase, partial [Pseudomonadota bacterium]